MAAPQLQLEDLAAPVLQPMLFWEFISVLPLSNNEFASSIMLIQEPINLLKASLIMEENVYLSFKRRYHKTVNGIQICRSQHKYDGHFKFC